MMTNDEFGVELRRLVPGVGEAIAMRATLVAVVAAIAGMGDDPGAVLR